MSQAGTIFLSDRLTGGDDGKPCSLLLGLGAVTVVDWLVSKAGLVHDFNKSLLIQGMSVFNHGEESRGPSSAIFAARRAHRRFVFDRLYPARIRQGAGLKSVCGGSLEAQ